MTTATQYFERMCPALQVGFIIISNSIRMQSTIIITELKINARLTDSAVPVDVFGNSIPSKHCVFYE